MNRSYYFVGKMAEQSPLRTAAVIGLFPFQWERLLVIAFNVVTMVLNSIRPVNVLRYLDKT